MKKLAGRPAADIPLEMRVGLWGSLDNGGYPSKAVAVKILGDQSAVVELTRFSANTCYDGQRIVAGPAERHTKMILLEGVDFKDLADGSEVALPDLAGVTGVHQTDDGRLFVISPLKD